ncbi:MAG: hypothetical protein ACI4HI_13045 [Lachnospiraceae bacterium]
MKLWNVGKYVILCAVIVGVMEISCMGGTFSWLTFGIASFVAGIFVLFLDFVNVHVRTVMTELTLRECMDVYQGESVVLLLDGKPVSNEDNAIEKYGEYGIYMIEKRGGCLYLSIHKES